MTAFAGGGVHGTFGSTSTLTLPSKIEGSSAARRPSVTTCPVLTLKSNFPDTTSMLILRYRRHSRRAYFHLEAWHIHAPPPPARQRLVRTARRAHALPLPRYSREPSPRH